MVLPSSHKPSVIIPSQLMRAARRDPGGDEISMEAIRYCPPDKPASKEQTESGVRGIIYFA